MNKVNPQGTVPILKDNDTDAYIIDSDTISDYLEEKYAPGSDVEKKVLGKLVDCPQPGANVWPRFMDFLSGSGDKGAVEAELRQVEDVVGDKSPYVGGRDVNAWDVALAPRLYLARVVCKNIKVSYEVIRALPKIEVQI